MTQRIAAEKAAFVFVLMTAITACQTQTRYTRWSETTVTPLQTSANNSTNLNDIDLTKMGHITPNSRAQDRHNQIEIVDRLIAHGNDSIPFLINKLDDETRIDARVVDYWNPTTIGDVALFILSDFSEDSAGNETIRGASWDNFLERGSNRNMSAIQLFDRQVTKLGRRGLKAKWERIWTTYKDRIVWDDKERCFKVV